MFQEYRPEMKLRLMLPQGLRPMRAVLRLDLPNLIHSWKLCGRIISSAILQEHNSLTTPGFITENSITILPTRSNSRKFSSEVISDDTACSQTALFSTKHLTTVL